MTQKQSQTIRGELLARGHTFASIAGELGVSRQLVSQVAAGRITSARVREAVAAKLGRDPFEGNGAAPAA